MNKITKTILLTVITVSLLTGCGNEDADPNDTKTPEAASVGELINGENMGAESSECPTLSAPVCTDSKVTYRNACDAEKAGETEWTKGSC